MEKWIIYGADMQKAKSVVVVVYVVLLIVLLSVVVVVVCVVSLNHGFVCPD